MTNMLASLPEAPARVKLHVQSPIANHHSRITNHKSQMDFIHVHRPPAERGGRILLMLHGTGGNEHDLVPLADALLPGAGVLSPRGQVLERGMPRFFRRLAEGVFDIDDLKRRSQELADFIASAAAKYSFATN